MFPLSLLLWYFFHSCTIPKVHTASCFLNLTVSCNFENKTFIIILKKPERWLVNLLECLGIKNKTKFKPKCIFSGVMGKAKFCNFFIISWLRFWSRWCILDEHQNKTKQKDGGNRTGERKQNQKKSRKKCEEPENWKENIPFPKFPVNTSGPAESNSICVYV